MDDKKNREDTEDKAEKGQNSIKCTEFAEETTAHCAPKFVLCLPPQKKILCPPKLWLATWYALRQCIVCFHLMANEGY